jgi:hypothetical protein
METLSSHAPRAKSRRNTVLREFMLVQYQCRRDRLRQLSHVELFDRGDQRVRGLLRSVEP